MIRLIDGTLHVKHGWAFDIDIPLEDIESARPAGKRPWALGVHKAADGWLVNASRQGIVELKFARPIKPKKVPPGTGRWLGGPVGSLYISLAEPESFIAAVKPR